VSGLGAGWHRPIEGIESQRPRPGVSRCVPTPLRPARGFPRGPRGLSEVRTGFETDPSSTKGLIPRRSCTSRLKGLCRPMHPSARSMVTLDDSGRLRASSWTTLATRPARAGWPSSRSACSARPLPSRGRSPRSSMRARRWRSPRPGAAHRGATRATAQSQCRRCCRARATSHHASLNETAPPPCDAIAFKSSVARWLALEIVMRGVRSRPWARSRRVRPPFLLRTGACDRARFDLTAASLTSLR
jgi:hypothetical protein